MAQDKPVKADDIGLINPEAAAHASAGPDPILGAIEYHKAAAAALESEVSVHSELESALPPRQVPNESCLLGRRNSGNR
jgi:hypothetical protein